jgi:hypothetical protein
VEFAVAVRLHSCAAMDGETEESVFAGRGVLTQGTQSIELRYTTRNAQGEPHYAQLRFFPAQQRVVVRRPDGVMELVAGEETQVVLARAAGSVLRGLAQTEALQPIFEEERLQALSLHYHLQTADGVGLGDRSLHIQLDYSETDEGNGQE